MSLTIEGELPIGVVVDGAVHKAFTLRTATVQDNIDATDQLTEAGEAPDLLRLSTTLIALQLVRLGALRRDQITTQLLRGMHPADWNVLDKASVELEKKIRRDGPIPSSAGGSPPAPSSPATGSTQTA